MNPDLPAPWEGDPDWSRTYPEQGRVLIVSQEKRSKRERRARRRRRDRPRTSILLGFGKHRGKTIAEVFAEEPGYCFWMRREGVGGPEFAAEIDRLERTRPRRRRAS